MRAPRFWWRPETSLAAKLMTPVGAVVGALAARRMRRPPQAHVAVPVLCIGNPTVGGAGKTPVALAVADVLRAGGVRPVFLTRGYGGRLHGPVQVADHTAAEVGDEALLLAAAAPTVVARDRAAGGRFAARLGDVVIMDDGFQNPRLAKSWSALVVDAAVGLGNGRVTPAGPMRAPFAAHAARADALVLVDAGEGLRAPVPAPAHLPIFRARLVPQAPVPLDGTAVVAFAGIGRPEKFFASLAALGAVVVDRHAFADHHVYREAEARRLLAAAHGGVRLATTGKDAVRLAGGGPAARALAEAAVVVDVRAELDAPLVAAVRTAAARPASPVARAAR